MNTGWLWIILVLVVLAAATIVVLIIARDNSTEHRHRRPVMSWRNLPMILAGVVAATWVILSVIYGSGWWYP